MDNNRGPLVVGTSWYEQFGQSFQQSMRSLGAMSRRIRARRLAKQGLSEGRAPQPFRNCVDI